MSTKEAPRTELAIMSADVEVRQAQAAALKKAEIQVSRAVAEQTKHMEDLFAERVSADRPYIPISLDRLQQTVSESRIIGKAKETALSTLTVMQESADSRGIVHLTNVRGYIDTNPERITLGSELDISISVPATPTKPFDAFVIDMRAGYLAPRSYCMLTERRTSDGIGASRALLGSDTLTTLEKLTVMGIFADAVSQALEELPTLPQPAS